MIRTTAPGPDRMTGQSAGVWRLRSARVPRRARGTAGRIRAMRRQVLAALASALSLAAFWPTPAHASFLKGDALDALANGVAWAALIIVPIVAIGVFLIIHILPEKIAEKRRHPQLSAIKTLCLLSLVFGGMLWPFAWLWAYTKPVMHKLAYGTDVDDTLHHGEALSPLEDADVVHHHAQATVPVDEVQVLRQRIAALEARLAAQSPHPPHPPQGGGV
jgi:CBS domain containing-hemolysin-like protein